MKRSPNSMKINSQHRKTVNHYSTSLRSLLVCDNNFDVFIKNGNEEENKYISRFRSFKFVVVNFVREGNLKCHPRSTQVSNRTQVFRKDSLQLTYKLEYNPTKAPK